MKETHNGEQGRNLAVSFFVAGAVFGEVGPRTVNGVSDAMRTKYVSLSAGQAQYLVRLDRDTCCSAHCK